VVNFDPDVEDTTAIDATTRAYSRLLQVNPGHMGPTNWELGGAIAESWEWSPDRLQLTMKLRQDAGFAPVAPVNGRKLDVGDVDFSFKRYLARGVNRTDYFNSLNPEAPILSIDYPDARTMVFKVKYPTVGLTARLAGRIRNIWILPKEADGAVDLRTKSMGTGPWYLADYQPSSRLSWKRNPNFYDKEHPYYDEISEPILTDPAARLAQLRTGNVYTLQKYLRAEYILPLKKDVPALTMYAGDVEDVVQWAQFGWKPNPAEKTPFRDERVRQAYSMALDRDLFIDIVYNVSKFKDQGVPMETRWATCLSPGFTGWWLDPKSKDFGENSKYFQHNIAESKKLLAAAGYEKGIDITSNWPVNVYAPVDVGVPIIEGMAQEAGFRFNTVHPAGNSDWNNNYRDSQGNFEGVAYRSFALDTPEAVERLAAYFNRSPGNAYFSGFDSAGKGDHSGDKELESMVLKARAEFDTDKRKQAVHEVQRQAGKHQYVLNLPGVSNTFLVTWPTIRNANVFRGGTAPVDSNEWIDETQAPLKQG
jgi:ABC-type transport system substrate-binding protein